MYVLLEKLFEAMENIIFSKTIFHNSYIFDFYVTVSFTDSIKISERIKNQSQKKHNHLLNFIVFRIQFSKHFQLQ